MIDLTIYDFLEKVVRENESILTECQILCECEETDIRLGINSLQSIVRRSVVVEQQEEPVYSRVVYGKNGYESIKLENMKFDIDNISALLANVPGIVEKEKWAIFMTVLSIISELRKIRIKLSPVMGMIISFMYKNGYSKKYGKMISEENLRMYMAKMFVENISKLEFENEFTTAINDLLEIGTIEMKNGDIILIEEVRI